MAFAWQWSGLIVACAAGLATALYYVLALDYVRPIFDDTYISLTFAQNLANTGRLSFDGNSWATGATSLLHVAILAGLIKLGAEPVVTSVIVGVVSHVFLIAGVYLLAWSIFRTQLAAFLAALAISFSAFAVMDAGNGLETSLFMALLTFSMASYFLSSHAGGQTLTGVLVALTILARPEGAALIPALLIYHWLARDESEPRRQFIAEAIRLAGPGVVVVLAIALLSLGVNGTLTGTANAKMRFFREYAWPMEEKIRFGLDHVGLFLAPVITLIALAAPVAGRRPALLFALFWAPVLVAYVYLFPGGLYHYFYRYQHPVLPLIAVLAGGGGAYLINAGLRNGVVAKALVLTALVIVIVPLWQQFNRWQGIYEGMVRESRNDLEVMAKELNRIIPAGQVLATHDIGAVRYYGRFEVLDLVGLVNAKVIPYYEGRRIREYVEEAEPDYLLIFPKWDTDYMHIFPGTDPERYQLIKAYPGGPLRMHPYLLYRIVY
jgi:hypothetical protein